jgi:5-formyltetrahydrofolate cyclo-ligase
MFNTKSLRAEMLAARRALTPEAAAKASAAVCERLKTAPIWDGVKTVLSYLAYGRELDPSGLNQWLWQRQIRVLVPVCSRTEKGVMEACLFQPDTELIKSSLGVLEPLNPQIIKPEAVDLVLAPGVVFDRHGNRIGHGGGYYDRYLQKTPAIRLGLLHHFQLTDNIARESWDQPMDYLCTDKEWISCGPKRE